MESLRIFPDAEVGGMLSDVPDRSALTECGDLRVGGLPSGTVSGKPTVIIAAKTPDGEMVVVETTLALYLSSADALKARHGDPRE